MLKAIVICSNGVKTDSAIILSVLRNKGMKVRNVFMFRYEVKGVYIDFKTEITVPGNSADILVTVNKNMGYDERICILRDSVTAKSKFRGKIKLATIEDLIWFMDTRLEGTYEDMAEGIIEETGEELHEVILRTFSPSEIARDKGESLTELIMRCNALLYEKVYIKSLDITITFVSWCCMTNNVKQCVEVKLNFSESRGKE